MVYDQRALGEIRVLLASTLSVGQFPSCEGDHTVWPASFLLDSEDIPMGAAFVASAAAFCDTRAVKQLDM